MSEEAVNTVAAEFGSEHGTDVFYISASVDPVAHEALHASWIESHRRRRCVLVLTTYGGDPNSAYRMARFLRRAYEHVTILVLGTCKSAGTLLAIGGHELAMGARGELGPLDMQTRNPDELGRLTSGIDIMEAVDHLITYSQSSFETHFVDLLAKSGGGMTTKTAAEIATRLTEGLIRPLAGQIDPLRLAEEARAVQIAVEYGVRLGVSERVLRHLMGNYPSHGFVIDYEEAKEFLPSVRRPNELELRLEAALADLNVGLYFESQSPIATCIGGPDEKQGDLFDDTGKQAASPVGHEDEGSEEFAEPGEDSQAPSDEGPGVQADAGGSPN